MASIADESLTEANRFARRRGPDFTSVVRDRGTDGWHLTFLHNLLDISGTAQTQPTTIGDRGERLWCLFNGEIYNFRNLVQVESDTAAILPRFQAIRAAIGREFDGEFAIAIYSERENALFVFTDPFLTKPLFLGRGGNGSDGANGALGVATCASSLRSLGFTDVRMAEPNATHVFHFKGDECIEEKTQPVWSFDVRQHKTSYDDWETAFLKAVRKRADHGSARPSVFLSSGYDSGAICLALNLQGIAYDTFSIEAGEQSDVLRERLRRNQAAVAGKSFRYSGVSRIERERQVGDFVENVEPFSLHHEDAPGVVMDPKDDHGVPGMNFLAEEAARVRRVVNLSGSGADEILSDYGINGIGVYHHSEFGGRFPDDLVGFFPWKKFYGDTQRSYLLKDEYVLGRHGIEGRYPFLDRDVVQEFLSLTAALKNRCYKAPIEQMFVRHRYPFERDVKRGFTPFIRRSDIGWLSEKVRDGIRRLANM